MKTTIDIVPFGGLGNRLRVFNSALFLGKEIGVEINLGWIVKAELNAEFSDLYQSATLPYGRIGKLKMKAYTFFLKHIFVQKYPRIYRFFLSFIYDLVVFDQDILSWPKRELQNRIQSSNKVLIASCYQFWEFRDYNNFRLKDTLKSKVDEVSQDFENVVGVHIRRTDHVDIIKSSSLNAYLNKMDELLRLSTDQRFFICSDDQGVKNELSQKYGNQVFFNEVELSRASFSGMEGAILDIYLLAKTNKIIANSKSSFAVMASKIGKLKEIIEV